MYDILRNNKLTPKRSKRLLIIIYQAVVLCDVYNLQIKMLFKQECLSPAKYRQHRYTPL